MSASPPAQTWRADLNERLLRAHETGRTSELIALYHEAACKSPAGSEQARFYATHAYVYALEHADARARDLFLLLKAAGGEEGEGPK